MNIFLSWSGVQSKSTANMLKSWLPELFPEFGFWMSEHDLQLGSPWSSSLHDQIKRSDFGILCLTPENLTAPWILYEAGALAIASRVGSVVPYLIKVDAENLKPPLSLFQSVIADEEGTWKLVKTIYAMVHPGVEFGAIRTKFVEHWPKLAVQLGLNIVTELSDGIMIMRPMASKLLSEALTTALRDRMRSLLREGHKKIVIDLVHVITMSSSGTSFIFPALAAEQRKETRLVIANLHPDIQALFTLTRLDRIVKITPTLEDAIQFLNTDEATT